MKLAELGGKRGFVYVRILNEGDHFGELALITNEKRSLSIRAKQNCKLLMLDRESFIRILGSIEENLMKSYDNEFERRMEAMKDKR